MFTLLVRHHSPPSKFDGPRSAARRLLADAGYLSGRDDGSSAAFRLFYDILLAEPQRARSIEELARELGASPVTVYYHLNRLKMLDLIEEVSTWKSADTRKAYRLRYGDLGEAWRFTEVNFGICMRRYGDVVRRIAAGARSQVTAVGTPAAGPARDFFLRVEGREFPAGKKGEALLADFLYANGYMSEKEWEEMPELRGSLPYRLVASCLLKKRERAWKVDEMASHLRTSRVTVYRHLKRLESAGLVERCSDGGGSAFRIRSGSLPAAWMFTEAYAGVEMKNYRETVDYIRRNGRDDAAQG